MSRRYFPQKVKIKSQQIFYQQLLRNFPRQILFPVLIFPEFPLCISEKGSGFFLQCVSVCVCIAATIEEGGKRSFARAMEGGGDAPWVPVFRPLTIWIVRSLVQSKTIDASFWPPFRSDEYVTPLLTFR
jgi:hypothetical protein